MKEMQAVNSQ